MKQLAIVVVSLLILAAAVTWLLMFRASGWLTPWDGYMLWALAPYGLLGCYALLRGRADSSRIRSRGSFWACVAALLLTLVIYLDASFVHVSSTSGLVFLFGTIWILIAGVAAGEGFIEWMEKKAAL